MRHATVAVIIGGCAFTGFGVAGGHPAPGAHSGAAKTVTVKKTATATKLVDYRGYEITVPASWPVYRLDNDPTRCVRYDISAVYLGTPGPSQLCPARLVGRTQTVSMTAPDGSGAPVVSYQRAALPDVPPALPAAGQAAASARPQAPGAVVKGAVVNGAVVQEPEQHQLRLATPHPAASLSATYGSDPAIVEGILRSLRRDSAAEVPAPRALWQAVPRQSVPPKTAGRPAALKTAGRPVPPKTAAWPVTLKTAGRPAALRTLPAGISRPVGLVKLPEPAAPATVRPTAQPTAHPTAPLTAHPTAPLMAHPTARPELPATIRPTSTQRTPEPEGTPTLTAATTPQAPAARPWTAMSGFDTCTAPSLKAMRAWRARYAATAIYIGGANLACDYGNLSASWIRSAKALGWSLLPVYVGYQAPCDSFPGLINPKRAAAQGRTAANNAAGSAAAFGLAKGVPIYYDMEAYRETNARCRTAVLTFLDAWTRQLRSRGYVSGVYSSAGSGARDLASTTKINGHALARPTAMWFALWDNKKNLNGQPYLPGSLWTRDRSKQYQGARTQKIGGITLEIDSDLVASAVLRPLAPRPVA